MEKHYEEKDQTPTLIDGGQVDEAIVNQAPIDKGVFNTGITSTQIEQVIDLPIPNTDDSGKVLKVDAEGKWELATDSEGTVVVANPTLAGTETNLTGLQVGAIKYKVPEGMEVLELANSSGTLTDAQYELASGNNCVIKYAGEYYSKATDDDFGYIVYNSVRDNEYGYAVAQYRIEIDRTNKQYQETHYEIVKPNPTFDGSESTLKGLKIGSSLWKIPTDSPVAYEGTSLLPSGLTFEGWSVHRAIKDGNMLWIVVSATISNTTSSEIQFTDIIEITLPSTISSKIYRTNGTTCDQAGTPVRDILYHEGFDTGSSTRVFRLTCQTANVLKLECNNTIAVSANSNRVINVRIPLFLDIGTVQ